jgi:hypothetical protein
MIVTDNTLHDTNTIASSLSTSGVQAVVPTSVIDSNQSIFNSADIMKITEWTIVGTFIGIILNKIFGLKS